MVRRLVALAAVIAGALIFTCEVVVPAQSPTSPNPSVFKELHWRALGPADADMLSAVPDAAFPYRVCGVERRRGALCVSSLGDDATAAGTPIAALTGVVRPDPADADVLYGSDVVRYDRRLDQAVPITPPLDLDFIPPTPAPLVFTPDGRTLYYGGKVLWRTATAGQTWTTAGPDLTGGGAADAISAVAFSPLTSRIIWTGTSDGLIQVSRDLGVTWTRRDPPAGANQPSPIVAIEGSHFDVNSAYVAVNAADASTPSAYRTRDAGETWKPLLGGLPTGRVYVVREDLLRRGLLFAGADAGLFVSFDDGESWQSFQLDLPRAPIHDLFVRDLDLVVTTSTRGLWMLPDISALRQTTSDVLAASAFLFRPAMAWRLRATASGVVARDVDGVAFHYLVGPPPTATLVLEIIATASGEVLRRFTSEAPVGSDNWLDASPGLHRRMWDLSYGSPGSMAPGPQGPGGPLRGVRVLPNVYQVRLTAGSRVLRQAVNIRMDPRVRVATADLAEGLALARLIDDKQRQLFAARAAVGAGQTSRLAAIDRALGPLNDVARSLQQFDGRPTPAVETAAAAAIARADASME